MSQKSYNNNPSLYLIPTPIGNLDDITIRAINIIKEVEVIFCEDTRVTSKLLNYLKIKKKLIASHEHNEEKVKLLVLKYLDEGYNVGLVSDRGTPIISDPGYKIASFVIENNYNVIGLPGPTAFVPALIASGIRPYPFLFYGFLSNKESKRNAELENLKRLNYSIIFYEAPHRIIKTLEVMLKVFGNRRIAICREISKKFEEIYRGEIDKVILEISSIKGEIVLIVEGNTIKSDFEHLTIIEHINLYVKEGNTEKEAIKMVSRDRNINKNIIYKEYHGGK
jgi:16S rRNA (cytidine1402-2'-O)-methyltransferase